MVAADMRLPLWAREMPPALPALALHLPLWGILMGLVMLAQSLHLTTTLSAVCVSEGILAWALSRLLKLPIWWQLINLAFFPGVCLAMQADTQPHWYLAGFLVLALTSLGSVRTRVPLFLSTRRAIETLGARLPATRGLRVIDLGCGLGGPLAGFAHSRPDCILHGVEAAPLNWLVSRLRLRGRADIRMGSLWDVDLAEYDVVYAYLSPAPMTKLWQKARREMRPGSLLVSNSFEVPGHPADEIIAIDDLGRTRLLLWQMR